ncbi:MAG: glutamyl-tRNA reductase [Methylococcales bacterium]|nr:glutamyl-tRNA reductase [Methylococcales bacterium]
MPLLALGLNHKTAPVNVREKLTFSPEKLIQTLKNLIQQVTHLDAAAILSTCNRTEIYCEYNHESASVQLNEWLCHHHNLSLTSISPFLYTYYEKDAVKHMLRVASGLDSLVLGEPQILGQMKNAYHSAQQAGSLGKHLSRLFQHTFAVAKEVRSDTAIGSSPVSVAFASVSLAKQVFGDLSHCAALLIGAGETIELVARHLTEQKINRTIVANRTLERAQKIVQLTDGEAITLSQIATHIEYADIIISSTASQLPILGKGTLETALKKRKHQPMVLIDIAVPRDIEPEVGDLDDIFLYTVDDLHEIIEENKQSRQEAAKQAEEIIENKVDSFLDWVKSLNSVDIICEYRQHAESIRDEMVGKAIAQLNNGKNVEEIIQQLGFQLTNKLLHTPSTQLHHATAENQENLLHHARYLLGTNNEE